VKFSFSSEQEEFRSNLRRLLADRSPTKEVRRLMKTDNVKGYQMPAPSPDSATRSGGRRLISLRGGNRGPAWLRRCRILPLWGFEGDGQ